MVRQVFYFFYRTVSQKCRFQLVLYLNNGDIYSATAKTWVQNGNLTISGATTNIANLVSANVTFSGGNAAINITAGNVSANLSGSTNLNVANAVSTLTTIHGGTGLASLTAGYIPYGNGTGAFNSSSGLFFDGTNLGIGTSSPNGKLHVGSTISAGSSTTTPTVITSDSTYGSNVAGSNFKLKLFDSTASYFTYGFGVSSTALEITSGNGGAIAFYRNGATPTESMRIDSSGNVGLGTSAPNASAILDAQSTTKGVRFPNMTTTQKTAITTPPAGLVVFDTTLAKLCVYSGSAWQTITSI